MTEFKNGSASQWRGVVKLDVTDVELYRMVEKRANQRLSWDEIAAEIGCEVQPLVEWFIEFHPPKERLPMVRARHQPITYAGEPITKAITPRGQARQFEAWRRQHEGAIKTRAENA